jgi:hypothetical protein
VPFALALKLCKPGKRVLLDLVFENELEQVWKKLEKIWEKKVLNFQQALFELGKTLEIWKKLNFERL